MFLLIHAVGHGDNSFPRVCGDVPIPAGVTDIAEVFSPRVRGCSVTDHAPYKRVAVFPACAGMFRQ